MDNDLGRPPYAPTPEEREKVQILRAQGMSKEAIASVIGIHVQTLNTHFSTIEISARKPEIGKTIGVLSFSRFRDFRRF
jgi:DNA invertase Pin-like site-specific DNA recombinase